MFVFNEREIINDLKKEKSDNHYNEIEISPDSFTALLCPDTMELIEFMKDYGIEIDESDIHVVLCG